jgi:hypothetical protein
LIDTTFVHLSNRNYLERRRIYYLPVGDLNLQKANRVSIDQGNVRSNVAVDGGAAIGVQIPIQTVGGTAQTHSLLLISDLNFSP